jgi:AhpD family alkylhydroperoxidase
MQLTRAAAEAFEAAGLSEGLYHLVKLRASQLNGCAYCIDMHSKDARSGGEREDRLYLLDAWGESPRR